MATGSQSPPNFRAALWACVGLVWLPITLLLGLMSLPQVAYASDALAAMQFAAGLSPALLTGFAWLASSLSGATALLIRIDRQLSAAPGKPLPRPWLFCGAHMAGSWLAGLLGFALAQKADGDIWELFVSVICFSFIGATAIERVAEKYVVSLPGASPAPPENRP